MVDLLVSRGTGTGVESWPTMGYRRYTNALLLEHRRNIRTARTTRKFAEFILTALHLHECNELDPDIICLTVRRRQEETECSDTIDTRREICLRNQVK